MTAYYNEHDSRKAAWLRELIAAGVGYGDGIVAPLAVEFIRAAMEWKESER